MMTGNKAAKKRYPYLDALRAWAILGVVWVHAFHDSAGVFPVWFRALCEQGARGVQLFYVLSAFSLFASLHQRGGNLDVKSFFKRRFWRIAPLFYLALGYYLWQDGIGPRYFLEGKSGLEIHDILLNLFFLHGFSPYAICGVFSGAWSVGVEALFYLCLPLFFARIKNLKTAFYALFISFLIKICWYLLLKNHSPIPSQRLWEDFLFFSFPSQLPVFFMGMIVFFVLFDKRELQKKQIFVIAGVLIGYCLIALSVSVPFVHILSGMVFTGLVAYLHRQEAMGGSGVFYRLSVNSATIFLGKISYSVYLSHFALREFLGYSGFSGFLNGYCAASPYLGLLLGFAALLFTSCFVSVFLYYFVEKPFLRWGRKE